MTRRYYESELVPAHELRPGTELFQRRVVASVVHTPRQVVLTFEDGTSEAYDLDGEPAVEVVTKGLNG